MAFLAPLFLLGALAAAVPVVLHLLRREPDSRVRFAAVRLLQHAPVEHADKRRLRELLLLALRIAALLLLALAFARPFIPTSAAGATTGVTVIALDTSFSLSSPGRFARAQALAREAVAAAPSGHLVSVVTFADSARVAQAPSGDRALAVSAIDAAATGFGATRYRAALSTAADALAGRDGRIVVVTDLQAAGWNRGEHVELPDGIGVEVVDVGPMPANIAVAAAAVAGDRLVATLRNAGESPRDVRVRLTLDGKPAGELVQAVPGKQSAEVSFAVSGGNEAAVSIDDPEGVPADDTRYVLLGAAARSPVLVISNAGDLARDAFYVEQALLAGAPKAAAYDVAAASAAQLSSWDADRLSAQAAIVVLSTRGLDQRGRELLAEFVESGGGVLVAAGPDVDGEVVGTAIGTPLQFTTQPASASTPGRTLAPVDLRHPVFQAFAGDAATLGLVRFRQITTVRGDSCLPLARFSTGEPALLECAYGEGRALIFGSDLNGRWNDFPLHATFVPFLHEAADYLGGGRGRRNSFVVGAVPPDVPQVPGLHIRRAPDRGAPANVRIRAGGAVAVNVDIRESDPTQLSADEFAAAVVRVPADDSRPPERVEARQQEERQNLWRYAILLMIAVLIAESLAAARTA